MAINISLDELLGWTAEERAKWLPWFLANPGAMEVDVQPGGRFPTVGALIDHIFLVELRHTQRLQGNALPTESGVAKNEIGALFAYGSRARNGLLDYLPTLSKKALNKPRDVVVASGTYQLTPRKLLFHMALHEVRHWAQIAAAVRMAGHTPPGDHDLFYAKSML